MARARSPDSIEAEKLYYDGMKLVDIAEKIGVPSGTVRRWKSTQKWDKDKSGVDGKESERSDKKKANVRKSKGAPKGNRNAAGHAPSTPIGNKNAQKHGAYSKINKVYGMVLSEEECSLMEDMTISEENELKRQIKLHTIREIRLLEEIKELKERSKNGLYVRAVKKKKRVAYDADGNGQIVFEDINTDTEYKIKGLAVLEAELTKVQRAKNKCIDSIIRLKAVNERYDDLLNGWKSKAAAESMGNNEEDMEEVHIYIPDNGRE